MNIAVIARIKNGTCYQVNLDSEQIDALLNHIQRRFFPDGVIQLSNELDLDIVQLIIEQKTNTIKDPEVSQLIDSEIGSHDWFTSLIGLVTRHLEFINKNGLDDKAKAKLPRMIEYCQELCTGFKGILEKQKYLEALETIKQYNLKQH